MVKHWIQDREIASWQVRPQRAPSVVSLSKTLCPHCLALVSTQKDLCIILRKWGCCSIERRKKCGYARKILMPFCEGRQVLKIGSCLLSNCNLSKNGGYSLRKEFAAWGIETFLKMGYALRKVFAPWGSKLFTLRVAPNQKGGKHSHVM